MDEVFFAQPDGDESMCCMMGCPEKPSFTVRHTEKGGRASPNYPDMAYMNYCMEHAIEVIRSAENVDWLEAIVVS